jgi:phosphonate C-P lyase system protein PhnH
VVRIAPSSEGEVRELDDVLEFGMSCHSGGTVELFVDPMLARARLTVVGDSPLAVALSSLGPRVGLPVSVVAHATDAARFPDAERVLDSDDASAVAQALTPGSFVVVATQGRRDVQGLRAALAARARQVFFVASHRKALVLKAALVEAGEDAAAWVRFHCGCALVAGAAPFVLDPDARLLDLDPGTDEEPERGATLILEVTSLEESPGWLLSGPGIRDTHHLRAQGAPPGFVRDWTANRARFPRGIDVILCAGTRIAALPRTVRIEEA